MRAFLAALRHGRGLHHVPIGVRDTDLRLVRVELHGAGAGALDVTDDHALVSLRPLVLGVALPQEHGALALGSCTLVVVDEQSGERLGAIGLIHEGTLPLARRALTLFRTVGCRDATAPAHIRWWRYALAARHARRAAAREDELRMTAADLRCLNVCYMTPRRMYLLGVQGSTELFTSSLVDRLSGGNLVFSLPSDSPEIEPIERSRTIAISAAPAGRLRDVLALGAYQRAAASVAPSSVSVRRSALHDLPVLSDGCVLEASVLATHPVGSHVLFVCRVDAEEGTPPPQLAYLSQMYVEWLARHERAVDVLG